MTRSNLLLWFFVGLQTVCALAVVASLLVSVLGLETQGLSWQVRELLEISASVGLIIGAVLGIRAVLGAQRQQAKAEEALRIASGAFAKVLDEKFDSYALTQAEREVAWLIVKGFPIKEAAALRGTSEGTIKSQSNAIYRKIGVSGRAQLLSSIVEDILLARNDD